MIFDIIGIRKQTESYNSKARSIKKKLVVIQLYRLKIALDRQAFAWERGTMAGIKISLYLRSREVRNG